MIEIDRVSFTLPLLTSRCWLYTYRRRPYSDSYRKPTTSKKYPLRFCIPAKPSPYASFGEEGNSRKKRNQNATRSKWFTHVLIHILTHVLNRVLTHLAWKWLNFVDSSLFDKMNCFLFILFIREEEVQEVQDQRQRDKRQRDKRRHQRDKHHRHLRRCKLLRPNNLVEWWVDWVPWLLKDLLGESAHLLLEQVRYIQSLR